MNWIFFYFRNRMNCSIFLGLQKKIEEKSFVRNSLRGWKTNNGLSGKMYANIKGRNARGFQFWFSLFSIYKKKFLTRKDHVINLSLALKWDKEEEEEGIQGTGREEYNFLYIFGNIVPSNVNLRRPDVLGVQYITQLRSIKKNR